MKFNKPESAKDRIILALDVDTMEEAEKLVVELKDYVGCFKVGLQLFTSCGFKPFEMIEKHGSKAFFDGKFHDILLVYAGDAVAAAIHDGGVWGRQAYHWCGAERIYRDGAVCQTVLGLYSRYVQPQSRAAVELRTVCLFLLRLPDRRFDDTLCHSENHARSAIRHYDGGEQYGGDRCVAVSKKGRGYRLLRTCQ